MKNVKTSLPQSLTVKSVFFAALFPIIQLSAQVGINTFTPTEMLDVNGTLRVRTLPNDGTVGIYTTGTDSSSSTPTQTFTADKPLVADTNGVFGVITNKSLIPNRNEGANFTGNTATSSPAMFVVKRFHLVDNVGGTSGRYNPNATPPTDNTVFNGDTTMAVDTWQAIISNVSYKFRSATTNTGAQFSADNVFNYRLKGTAGGTWKIIGDIINVQEEAYVDVLFIKSFIVAAEDRSL